MWFRKVLGRCRYPRKSGGGGIMQYRKYIGIYNPTLDDKGNSIVGIRILEESSKVYQSFKVPGTARCRKRPGMALIKICFQPTYGGLKLI